MKRIVFVVQNLNMNGANKSLINLLNVIDRKKYRVDLFVYRHQGILLDEIPADVRLLPEDYYMSAFETSLLDAMKNGNMLVKCVRVCAAVHKKLFHIVTDSKIKFLLWKSASILDNQYDVSIAWCEGSCHQFVLEKVIAKKKIAWCHIDDEAWPVHYKKQVRLLPQFDYICTVSQRCKKALLDRYALKSDKIKIIHNIMPVQSMQNAAQGNSPYENNQTVHILTLTRNEAVKKNQDAIEAAKRLYERGRNIHWWIFGGGFTENQYDRELPYLTIHRPVVNPYRYLKWCDIYVQTSGPGEAWGMGVNEAKIFNRPVVVSDTEVFREQIEDGVTGIMYDHTVEGLVDAIERLLSDKRLYARICDNLSKGEWSHSEDLEILYSLIEGGEKS